MGVENRKPLMEAKVAEFMAREKRSDKECLLLRGDGSNIMNKVRCTTGRCAACPQTHQPVQISIIRASLALVESLKSLSSQLETDPSRYPPRKLQFPQA